MLHRWRGTFQTAEKMENNENVFKFNVVCVWFQLLGMILSICLCRNIHTEDYTKVPSAKYWGDWEETVQHCFYSTRCSVKHFVQM